MKAKDLMSQPAITIGEHSSLEEAARTMLDNGIGCLPVIDEGGTIVGVITESSFSAKSKGFPFSTYRAPQVLGKWLSQDGIQKIFDAARDMPVGEFMAAPPITIDEEDTVDRAVKLMLDHDINRVPVIRDNKPVGMIARHDLLRLMAKRV